MKDLTTDPNYKKIRRKFLNDSETNRQLLPELICNCLKHYPKPENSPYLGGKRNNSISRRFRNSIPKYSQPTNKVLSDAMNFFQGSVLWHSPQTLQNITPPPILESVAISSIANLYNLNLLWDYVSAGVQEAEQQVVRQISNLVNWQQDSDGVFTYGGKGCLTYAIRVGLNRCCPYIATSGLRNTSPVVITTQFNHYIIESVCSWLGLGTKACIRVKTHANETVDLDDLHDTINNVLTQKRPIACIILSGGSTINLNIDNIKKTRKVVESACDNFHLGYKPFIYFDTVVSWPWLFFRYYNFKENRFNISPKILTRIKKVSNLLTTAKYADAIGIDFHKTGFAPYNCSAFFIKNKTELHSVVSSAQITRKKEPFGNNFLQHHTIEHSRSAAPVMAAWTVLQSMGIEGFQLFLAQMMIVGDVFRDILPGYGFELLNVHSLCHASIYYPKPPKGPNNFHELYNSSENVDYITQYVYELSKYFSEGGDGSFKAIDVGFLKCLSKTKSGFDMSAIRIYPMSPHITTAKALILCKQLGKMKKKFDSNFKYNQFNAPEVVHK